MAFSIIEHQTSLVILMSLVSALHLGASEDVTITTTCLFTEHALDANCRNRGLDYIPREYSRAISMDLRNNQLSTLEAGNFTGFSGLRYLDLEFNDIKDINIGAFGGCDSLLYIYLQFNSLTSVEEGAFEGAASLERLFLNQNSISKLHPDAFRGLGALTGLYIGHNEISQLPSGLFRHIPLLKYLHMGDNTLRDLSPDIFAGLSDLTYLNIMNNNLNVIQSGTFDPLKNLKELDLSGNLLVSINAFPTLPKLKILDLYDNEIQEIGSLPEMVDGLDELYLGQNNLSCTCSMNPIREWIQLHKSDEVVDASKVSLKCPSPPRLEGKVLDSILREDLCLGEVGLGHQHVATTTPRESVATTRHIDQELPGHFQTPMPRTSATSGRRDEDQDLPMNPHQTLMPRTSATSGRRDEDQDLPMNPHQTLTPRMSATSGKHNEDKPHDPLYTSNPEQSVASRLNNDGRDQYVPQEKYLFLGLNDAIVYVIVAGVTVSVIVLAMCVILRCLVWRTERYHQQLQTASMKQQMKSNITVDRNSFHHDENEDPYSYITPQSPTFDSAFGSNADFSDVVPGPWNAYPHPIDFESSESRLLGCRPLPPSDPIPTLARERHYRDPSHNSTQCGYQAVTIPEEYQGNLDVMHPNPIIPGYDFQDLGIQVDQGQTPYDSPVVTPQHSPRQIKHEYFTSFWLPTQGQQV